MLPTPKPPPNINLHHREQHQLPHQAASTSGNLGNPWKCRGSTNYQVLCNTTPTSTLSSNSTRTPTPRTSLLYLNVYVYVYVYVHTFIYLCIYVFVNIYVCICISICLCICICLCFERSSASRLAREAPSPTSSSGLRSGTAGISPWTLQASWSQGRSLHIYYILIWMMHSRFFIYICMSLVYDL